MQQKKQNSVNFIGDESYLYANKTEIYKFKVKNNMSEISVNGTVYDLSVDHSSIKKWDILNIHKYLMIKSNIK